MPTVLQGITMRRTLIEFLKDSQDAEHAYKCTFVQCTGNGNSVTVNIFILRYGWNKFTFKQPGEYTTPFLKMSASVYIFTDTCMSEGKSSMKLLYTPIC